MNTNPISQPSSVGRVWATLLAVLWWPVKRAAWLVAASACGVCTAAAVVAFGVFFALLILAVVLPIAIVPLGIYRTPKAIVDEISKAINGAGKAQPSGEVKS